MYSHILAAVDLDERASWEDVLPVAERLADCFEARITITTVVPDVEAIASGDAWPIAYRECLSAARSRLDSLASRVGPRVAVDVEVGSGTICGGIVEVAERVGADLIVLASHQPGLRDYLLAAHAARVARRACCSVLVVRQRAAESDRAMADRGSTLEPTDAAGGDTIPSARSLSPAESTRT